MRDPLCFCVTADSSFVPPLVYAMMGSSRDLAVGTVAVASLLISSMLGAEVSPTDNPALYLHLAFTATFFAGVFQASLGLLRYVQTKILSHSLNIIILSCGLG
jgi:MFS superfamily sulfate permease-like transporter